MTKSIWFTSHFRDTEAVIHMCFTKLVFVEISQNSQENSCAGVPF